MIIQSNVYLQIRVACMLPYGRSHSPWASSSPAIDKKKKKRKKKKTALILEICPTTRSFVSRVMVPNQNFWWSVFAKSILRKDSD